MWAYIFYADLELNRIGFPPILPTIQLRNLFMTDHDAYRKFMGKAEFDKAVNSLLGLIEGIAIDKKINGQEIDFLQLWLDNHRIRKELHPFNEIFPVVEEALGDGVLTEEEKLDITWLCERLTSEKYFDAITADLQKLHAIVAGIASDGTISVGEINGLAKWLQEHNHLQSCWPYDEIESLVTTVLADKKIDPDEHKLLMSFFGEFISVLDNNTVVNPAFLENSNINGICAICPEISFNKAIFCLTGASHKYTRNEFENVITGLGGGTSRSVSKRVNYLIIGADGNPCWAYACYGRKVERAVELRKQGFQLAIIHENDFHDAVLDIGN